LDKIIALHQLYWDYQVRTLGAVWYYYAMSDTRLVDETADFIKQKLLGEGSGHDWWHVYRVWQLAKTIAEDEPGS
jgi:hypothetical protein